MRKAGEGIRSILAENVRNYRRSRKISQEEMAELCGLHRTYVGAIERGERNVTLSTLEVLASALNVSIPELFSEALSDEQGKSNP